MKFELRAASRSDSCKIRYTLPNGKYDVDLLHFEDIKSVNVYPETTTYESLLGEKREVNKWFVDINTLEDLLALRTEVKHELIVGYNDIVIYDDYIE